MLQIGPGGICKKAPQFFRKIRCVKGFEAVPLNLYSNAFKYLPSTQPKIDCINVDFRENQDGVLISVSSVGPFVPKENIDSLWNVGKRMPEAQKLSDDGFGLGLPRIKKLCALSFFPAPWIESEHREFDNTGWGLFSVYIRIPRSAFVCAESTTV